MGTLDFSISLHVLTCFPPPPSHPPPLPLVIFFFAKTCYHFPTSQFIQSPMPITFPEVRSSHSQRPAQRPLTALSPPGLKASLLSLAFRALVIQTHLYFQLFSETFRSSLDMQDTVQGVLRTAGRMKKRFHTDALGLGQGLLSLPAPPAPVPACTVPPIMKTPMRSSRAASHDAPSYNQNFPLLLHHPDPRCTPRENRRALMFGVHGRALSCSERNIAMSSSHSQGPDR